MSNDYVNMYNEYVGKITDGRWFDDSLERRISSIKSHITALEEELKTLERQKKEKDAKDLIEKLKKKTPFCIIADNKERYYPLKDKQYTLVPTEVIIEGIKVCENSICSSTFSLKFPLPDGTSIRFFKSWEVLYFELNEEFGKMLRK